MDEIDAPVRPSEAVNTVVIEGVDAENTPPCEALTKDGSLCGKPSVTRVRFEYRDCGGVSRKFACRECVDWLHRKWMCCEFCSSRNYRWCET